MNMKITPESILDFISNFQYQNSYSPSIRDIQKALGSKSPTTIQRLVSKMVTSKRLKKNSKGEIILLSEYVNKIENVTSLAIPSVESDVGYHNLPGMLAGSGAYSFKVKSDKWKSFDILRGDLLIIKRPIFRDTITKLKPNSLVLFVKGEWGEEKKYFVGKICANNLYMIDGYGTEFKISEIVFCGAAGKLKKFFTLSFEGQEYTIYGTIIGFFRDLE